MEISEESRKLGLVQAGSGSGRLTCPASTGAGVVARKVLKVYFLLPNAHTVPVKSWSCIAGNLLADDLARHHDHS